MKISSALVGIAVMLMLPNSANAEKVGCTVGIETADKNLLPQAGHTVNTGLMVNPFFDCGKNLYVAGYGFLGTRGTWQYEADLLVGYRDTVGNFDFDARFGIYDVHPGGDPINIWNARLGIGYTFQLSYALKLRTYAMLDDQYMFHNRENTVGVGFGGTLSYRLLPQWTAHLDVGSWCYPRAGFLTTGACNVRVAPALEWEFVKGQTLYATTIAINGDNIAGTRDWNFAGKLGYKFAF